MSDFINKSKQLLEAAKDLSLGTNYEYDTETLASKAAEHRLHRLADKQFEEIRYDHLSVMSNFVDADHVIDVYDEDYLLALPISFRALSRLCEELIIAAQKLKLTPPQVWIDFSRGDFPFEKEMDMGVEDA